MGRSGAVAAFAARRAASCRQPGRRTGYAQLLGVLPVFLLVLGTGTAAALLPVLILIPLCPVVYPLTLVMLTGTRVWRATRIGRPAGGTSRADDATFEIPHQIPGTK
ncbi:hypothetical protein GCM10022403_099320 [Streptomyces coacervatus]|uniref:DUF2933 domain-containing protein n=1 Tax=Streptomyces coacervatus TaxID=647381 RepID=A0ABP7JR72_9ACTN